MTAINDSTATLARAVGAPRAARRALVVATAVGAALGVWVLAVPLLGGEVQVRSGSGEQAIGPGAVVVASLVAGGMGWALLALLEKKTDRARSLWTAVAAAVLALSLTGPLTSATTAGAAATLAALHVTAAAVLIPGLRRTSPAAGSEAHA